MRLESSAFEAHGAIPTRYSCFGIGQSPPLSWSGVPRETQVLALTIIDPDAPSGHFVHWIVYNLKPSRSKLPAGIATGQLDGPVRFGQNSRGEPGYTGMCPPGGVHHYRITLYALDAPINLKHATRTEFQHAIRNHVLAKAQLVGRFRHP